MNEQKFTVVPQSLTATDALKFVVPMVKSNAISAISGVALNKISCAVNDAPYDGRAYVFSPDYAPKIQGALAEIGNRLMSVRVYAEACTEDEQPYCYGEDVVQKLKVLRGLVNLPWIFQVYMGQTKKWQDIRLTDPRPKNKQYGNFSAEEYESINMAVRTIALQLLSITIITN